MKNVDIISRVVARKGETLSSSSRGAKKIDFSDYLLKSIWEKVFEIRTDSKGTEYIFGKLPVITQYGITMYSGDGVDIPSLASGLPFDGRTIWYNPDTNQIEVIGGTGGGSGEGVSNFWDLSGIPSWITISKPKYTYSEIEGTPDLSGFATQDWIKSQGYASAEELKKYIPISGYTEVSGEKNFTGGLKVNGSPIYYDTEKKYWKLEGDLLVTGGVTMYGSDSSFTPSTIMDAIAVDGTTISKSGGVLKVIGGTGGGVADSVAWANITGKPTWIGSSKPTYSYSEITGAISTTELQNYLTQNSYLNVIEGDNRYLKLSGGTLSSKLHFYDTNNYIQYTSNYFEMYNAKGQVGIGLYNDGTLKKIGGTSGIIWHSGNDGADSGLDADMLDGRHSSGFAIYEGIIGANDSSGAALIGYTYATQEHGGLYAGGFINFGVKGYFCQLHGSISQSALAYRFYNTDYGKFSDWKSIAFTDSNVASATKLQTARTIWGQSFDGTGNITGQLNITTGTNISLTYGTGLLTLGTMTSAHIAIDTNDIQAKANGTTASTLYLNDYGGNISMCGSGGNVGVGTASPSHKLHVSGNILATEGITTNDSITINGIKLSKSKDGVLYLDGNLVVKGGVTMYGTDATTSPSIFDSLPIASTTKKGVAYFDSEFFSVGSDGKVSFIGKTDGFNATELQNYLTQNSYLNTTQGDNRYLKLSGGTLTNTLTINRSTYPHIILNSTADNGDSCIRYDLKNVIKGYAGYSSAYGVYLQNLTTNKVLSLHDDGSLSYGGSTIWHSGNDGADSGLDADMLDGRHSSGFAIYEGIIGANDSSGAALIGYTYTTQEHGGLYVGGFINFGVKGYFCQLNGNVSHNSLAYRFYNTNYGKFSDWRQIAFTDSNVASATKLQTARTIWGQSFDGTGNVSGDFVAHSVKIYDDNVIEATSNKKLHLNYYATSDMSLCYGGGNVGVGTTSPSHKLHVVGNTYLNGDVFADELNTFDVLPRTSNAYSCGDGNLRWYQMYSYIGDFSGAVSMGSTLNVTGMTTMTNATITGYLRLKDTTNYGRTIYFGDGELCYLEEASDDVLTIYANAGIKLNTSSTSYNVSINTNLLVSGGITMYSQRSLKNIQDERGLSLGELRAIKPTRYTWKDGRDNRIHFGGIADDIQQVLPEVVYKTNDGVLTMDYGNAAFAIASSLIKPVVDHEKRIAMLEEENKQLRQEVERLKSA